MVSQTPPRLAVEILPLASLRPNPRNPRVHSDRQVKQISRSLKSFGFNVPVLIDAEGTILAGTGRILAAKHLGMTELPTIRLDHLTEAQAQAFTIADNRLTEIATWDDRLLGEILGQLASADLAFSVEDTGFSMAEIDLHIAGLSGQSGSGPDAADQLPAMAGQAPVSLVGDLWRLGKHCILCGNALDGASYGVLTQAKPANLVFTDPPYNVPIQGHVSGKGVTRHREFSMAAGELTDGQFTEFLTTVLHRLAEHTIPGSIHYVCMDWRHQFNLLSAGRQAYTELKNLAIWVKDHPGMGSFYRSQHELVFVFKNGTAPHRNNIQLGQYGRNRSNVWPYPRPSGLGRKGDEGNLLALHPTPKPVRLIADAILDCSARGDVVLDPFLGSGSTLIAAQRVGRACYGMEIDPLYVDTAIRRWQRFTGDVAVHATTGILFDKAEASLEASNGG